MLVAINPTHALCLMGVFCFRNFYGRLTDPSVKPEVIDAAKRLLGVDHVEVDHGVDAHCHRIAGQNLIAFGSLSA